MRHRMAITCSTLVLLLGLGATGAAGAATTGSAGGSLHDAAQAKPPAASAPAATDDLLCAGTGSGLCLNRKSCGTTNGTKVIMWAQDFDNCEDFEVAKISNMCNGGKVSATCPFTSGSGLNNHFINYSIIQIQAYNEMKCLATDANGNGALGTCPDMSGNGGSDGTIFVVTPGSYLVNRYWSDANFTLGEYNTPAYMCSSGTQGVQVILNEGTANAGYCQWGADIIHLSPDH